MIDIKKIIPKLEKDRKNYFNELSRTEDKKEQQKINSKIDQIVEIILMVNQIHQLKQN